MARGLRHASIVLAFLLVLSLGFAGGVGVSVWWSSHQERTRAPRAAAEVTPAELRNRFEVFWEAWHLAEEEYYGRPVDPQKMVYGAAKGMMQSLGDDYTTFLSPSENEHVKTEMRGSFSGIGVTVEMKDKQLTVVAPIEGSPAERAGVRAGDVILSVDGTSLADRSVDEAVAMIRGPRGTKVALLLRRPGARDPFPVEIERADIVVRSVTSRRLDGDIGYVRATIFGDHTTAQLDEEITRLDPATMNGLILDLRNNGGGYVQAAREMLGRFLASGTALYESYSQDEDGKRIEQRVIPGTVKAYQVPLIVLVNGGTASASEIVAGALQDGGRATLVGEKTFGKGSVQDVRELSDGSSVRITIAKWLTPKKKLIQGQGLAPDVEVKLSPDDLTAGRDPQLDRARQLLQSRARQQSPAATGALPPASPAAGHGTGLAAIPT